MSLYHDIDSAIRSHGYQMSKIPVHYKVKCQSTGTVEMNVAFSTRRVNIKAVNWT